MTIRGRMSGLGSMFLGLVSTHWNLLSGTVPVALFMAATYLFTSTPDATGQHHGVLVSAYSSLGAFTFSSLIEPRPPADFRSILLWLILVFMPLVTAAVVVDFLRRNVMRPDFMVRGLREHVVIAGFGDHGRKILERLQAVDPKLRFVVLDQSYSPGSVGPGFSRPIVLPVQGDIQDPVALQAAGVVHASCVIFATGNPMTNLAGARSLRDLTSTTAISVLVDRQDLFTEFVVDLGLDMNDLVDQFEAASTHVSDTVARRMGQVGDEVRIAVLGFGRFGRAVLARLVDSLGCRRLNVTVVDQRKRDLGELCLGREVPCALKVVEKDAVQWCQGVHRSDGFHVVVIALADDVIGLRCAAYLRRAGLSTLLVMRTGPKTRMESAIGLTTCDVTGLCADRVAAVVQSKRDAAKARAKQSS